MRFIILIAAILFVVRPAYATDAADCPMKDRPCTFVILSPSGWLEVGDIEDVIPLAAAATTLKPYADMGRLFLVTDFPANSCTFLNAASTLNRAGLSFFVIQPGRDCEDRSTPWAPQPETAPCLVP